MNPRMIPQTPPRPSTDCGHECSCVSVEAHARAAIDTGSQYGYIAPATQASWIADAAHQDMEKALAAEAWDLEFAPIPFGPPPAEDDDDGAEDIDGDFGSDF